jgi:hypothetical protein
VADGGGLENHCARKGTGGSNPSPSATSLKNVADLVAEVGGVIHDQLQRGRAFTVSG